MSEEEFKKQKSQIIKKKGIEISELSVKFAMSNNEYKFGDIVTDHIGSVLVESIKISISSTELPICVYYGFELKKDKTIRKDKKTRSVYGCNLIK